MQQKQRLLVAGLVVVALVVLVAVFGREQRADVATTTTSGDAWLAGLKPALAEVSKVRLQSGAAVSTLVRKDQVWGVEERAAWPVDFTRLGSLLDDLAEAHRVEQKTSKPEFFDRLGLADIEKPDSKAVLVEIWRAAGDAAPAWRVLIGNAAEGRNGRYVREAGGTETWLIDKSPQALAEPTDWLEKKLLGIDFERVANVTRTLPAGGGFTASRKDRTQPSLAADAIPAGQKPRYDTVFDGTARAVLGADLDDVRRADALGFDKAALARDTIQCFDGLTLEIDALKDKDGNWIRVRALAGEPVASAPAVAELAPAQATPAEGAPAAADATKTDAASKATAAPADAAKADAAAPAEDPARKLATEVAALNARVDGWAFKVSDYVYGELSKPLGEYIESDKPAEPQPAAKLEGKAPAAKPAATKPAVEKPADEPDDKPG